MAAAEREKQLAAAQMPSVAQLRSESGCDEETASQRYQTSNQKFKFRIKFSHVDSFADDELEHSAGSLSVSDASNSNKLNELPDTTTAITSISSNNSNNNNNNNKSNDNKTKSSCLVRETSRKQRKHRDSLKNNGQNEIQLSGKPNSIRRRANGSQISKLIADQKAVHLNIKEEIERCLRLGDSCLDLSQFKLGTCETKWIRSDDEEFDSEMRNFDRHKSRDHDQANWWCQLLVEQLGPKLHQLHLQSNKILHLPSDIGQLCELRELYLTNNQLKDLPKNLLSQQLTCLEVLDLRYNKLERVPTCIRNLCQLTCLHLDHNKISHLEELFCPGTRSQQTKTLSNETFELLPNKLRILTLQNNRLVRIPELFGQSLNFLIRLDLSYNRLVSLPESLCNLTQLTCLNLKHNKLRKLPEQIGNLRQLIQIGLKQNQLEHLPESLGKCSYLNELKLDRNLLSNLPKKLLQKLNIEHLSLYKNKLKNFPYFNNISEFRNIIKLDLANNEINKIPFGIFGEANQFKMLNMNHNLLSSLPLDIGNWLSLEHLELCHNRLDRLPDDIQHLAYLEYLNVGHNYITCLPSSLGHLKRLRYLDLSRNQLNFLPPQLGHLESLQVLDVSANCLVCIPAELVHCRLLREVNLERNQLRFLPYELGSLEWLQVLQLSYNRNLDSLPLELGLCTSLHSITFTECPLWTTMPPEALSQGSCGLVDYLRIRVAFYLSHRMLAPMRSTPGSLVGVSSAAQNNITSSQSSQGVAACNSGATLTAPSLGATNWTLQVDSSGSSSGGGGGCCASSASNWHVA